MTRLYKENVSKEVIEKFKQRETVEKAIARGVKVEKIPPKVKGKRKPTVINKDLIPENLKSLLD